MVHSLSLRSWSIPACAGAPVTLPNSRYGSKVYPRVCGGTVLWIKNELELAGLSPRVRGHPFDVAGDRPVYRSIPACAGAPKTSPAGTGELTVYPRVCGGTGSAPTYPRI